MTEQPAPITEGPRVPEPPRRSAARLRTRDAWWGQILDETDSLVYFLVGASFLLAALASLAYGLVRFGYNIWMLSRSGIAAVNVPNGLADTVIALLSDLLLTLIILEIMGTVIHYLRLHTTSLKPFLFIGIISATRTILAVGAQLVAHPLAAAEFRDAMIELGASAGVIIALGIALRLVSTILDESATIPAPPPDGRSP